MYALEIAIKQSAELPKRKPFIHVKDGEYTVELSVDKINFIESEGNYLIFYTNDKTYKLRSTIKNIMSELSTNTFVQTHRAYIVNKNKIEKFNNKSLIIKDTVIPISENYLENIKQFI